MKGLMPMGQRLSDLLYLAGCSSGATQLFVGRLPWLRGQQIFGNSLSKLDEEKEDLKKKINPIQSIHALDVFIVESKFRSSKVVSHPQVPRWRLLSER